MNLNCMLLLASFMAAGQLQLSHSASLQPDDAAPRSFDWSGPNNRFTLRNVPKLPEMPSFFRSWMPKSFQEVFVKWVPTTPPPKRMPSSTFKPLIVPSGSGYYGPPPHHHHPHNGHYSNMITSKPYMSTIAFSGGLYGVPPAMSIGSQLQSGGFSSYSSYSDEDELNMSQGGSGGIYKPPTVFESVQVNGNSYGLSGSSESDQVGQCSTHVNHFKPSPILGVEVNNIPAPSYTPTNTYSQPSDVTHSQQDLPNSFNDVPLEASSNKLNSNLIPPSGAYFGRPEMQMPPYSDVHFKGQLGSGGYANHINDIDSDQIYGNDADNEIIHQQELEGNSQLLPVASGYDTYSGSSSVSATLGSAPLHAASFLAFPRHNRPYKESRYGQAASTAAAGAAFLSSPHGEMMLGPPRSSRPLRYRMHQVAGRPYRMTVDGDWRPIPSEEWIPTTNWMARMGG